MKSILFSHFWKLYNPCGIGLQNIEHLFFLFTNYDTSCFHSKLNRWRFRDAFTDPQRARFVPLE